MRQVVRFARLIQAPRSLRPDPAASGAGVPGGDLGVGPGHPGPLARLRRPGSPARRRAALPGRRGRGVELERYAKQLGHYQGAAADADPAWSAVWWFTPIGRVPLLTQWPQEAGGGDVHQVYQLPRGGDLVAAMPSAGARYPSGLPAQPPDQRLHDAGEPSTPSGGSPPGGGGRMTGALGSARGAGREREAAATPAPPPSGYLLAALTLLLVAPPALPVGWPVPG